MQITDMTHDDLLQAAHNMKRYGGSFASNIAEAFFVADTSNKAILTYAFRHLFEIYAPDNGWGK